MFYVTPKVVLVLAALSLGACDYLDDYQPVSDSATSALYPHDGHDDSNRNDSGDENNVY